ncbi:MAG: aminoacyl-tRNA deacylase [Anaerolineae bacterium]|nr:aminoacyl-tRNA deacylase [Anaerolineae bacterium]MDQ7035124.1 aminoacyl-tRNA deacylase [Anaerolineae bacterium]
MAKKPKKLNSMRLLDANNVPYEVLEYDSSIKDAQQVAEMVGMPPFMVYKTLIVQSVKSNMPFIAMIACDCQLDLKRMASAAKEKKVHMAKHSTAEKLTGLQVGGISALMLMDKNWSVYIDQPAMELQNIVISAGQRGLQLRIPVMPLLNLLKAKIAEISQTDES